MKNLSRCLKSSGGQDGQRVMPISLARFVVLKSEIANRLPAHGQQQQQTSTYENTISQNTRGHWNGRLRQHRDARGC
jgi:hypothetical protein